MIGRIWRGWAKREMADEYERLLTSETLPALHRVPGYKGSHFMRRDLDGEVEIVEITYWESMAAIEAFAGADSTKAVVPPETQVFLTRWDDRSVHYEATWCP
ncbi:antibiotic biosynthesis monooxygenase family protein [Enterovirga aerilata]|uniref:Antibiotic biosynthesis monooxygenase n=1 Tax=Enterovirga aerilata TaxID=2730920 RepID=A0A849IJA3_9HYPH|nr:antibiotic biosynthesis monooxygenase [Enterovirga sp. DB1703]NNM74023.1 antibiotic biosynthesis monooxygenase [Enterovirga sp. DB1703]